jgi:hypothetical protein
VFISHSHEDNATGERVCAAFEKQGIKCWYSSRLSDLEPGVEWDDDIVRALDRSFAVVLIFSKAANGSRWVKRELAMAGYRGLDIYPLRIQDLKPTGGMEAHLVSVQWTNAFAGPVDGYLEPIAKRLRAFFPEATSAAKPSEPPKSPVNPAADSKSVLDSLEEEMAGLLGRPPDREPLRQGRSPVVQQAADPQTARRTATSATPLPSPPAPVPISPSSPPKVMLPETSREPVAHAEAPASPPRPAPGRTVTDESLKGFRDVIAEAEALGEATAQGAKTARECAC